MCVVVYLQLFIGVRAKSVRLLEGGRAPDREIGGPNVNVKNDGIVVSHPHAYVFADISLFLSSRREIGKDWPFAS